MFLYDQPRDRGPVDFLRGCLELRMWYLVSVERKEPNSLTWGLKRDERGFYQGCHPHPAAPVNGKWMVLGRGEITDRPATDVSAEPDRVSNKASFELIVSFEIFNDSL